VATAAVNARPIGPTGTYTVRALGAGGFEAVEAALARKCADLATRSERHAVIVSLEADPAHYFTQTLVDFEDGAWVEAVSNEFIAQGHELDAAQHRLLGLFGFHPPDDWSPNHYRLLPPPADWTLVARLLVGPLEAVYGATPRTELTVDVSWVSRPSTAQRRSGAARRRRGETPRPRLGSAPTCL